MKTGKEHITYDNNFIKEERTAHAPFPQSQFPTLPRACCVKFQTLFGLEKPFVKLQPTYSVKLVFSYVVKGIKLK